MRYISDDGQIFETEKECKKWEQTIKNAEKVIDKCILELSNEAYIPLKKKMKIKSAIWNALIGNENENAEITD